MYDETESGLDTSRLWNLINGTEELKDKYEIENVLSAIKEMNRKVDFLKELKKRRAALADAQITSEEDKVEKLKDAIRKCMAKSKDKSLDFPGVGKVSLRNSKGTWTITDEEGLKSHLESLGKFGEVSEQNWKFKKKDLNSLLDELERNNNTSGFVAKSPDDVSVSISFPKPEITIASIPSLSNATAADAFDKLDI
jgi:hypothetical protein